MKKCLLTALGLLGLTLSLFAQSPVIYQDENVEIIDSVQVSFEQIVDSVFVHVDLSQVPSGILIDKTLSTLDYSNFTGQPDLPDTADLRKWRHLYNVYYRNAVNEAQKWQADLQDSLAIMDSLMRVRDLPGDPTSAMLACNLLVSNPQQWRTHYERVQQNVLQASQRYPPLLPRIRKWIDHSDSLLQKVYAIEADTNFTVLNDSNRVDFLSWSQLYNFMNQAAIDPQQPPLPQLEEKLEPFMKEGQSIPLLFLDMQYHRIKPDAVQNNLLRFSGIQLYDVARRTESPYEAMTFLAATPAVLRLEERTQSFIIRPELMFGNQQKAIKSIAVDFGDGLGFQEVNFNKPISIQYATPGEKRMIFKVTYKDCSFAISHTAIVVNEESSTANGRIMRTQDFRNDPDDQFPIRAERPYEDGYASGNVIIEYGCGNDRLMKPLIIVEGFNPEEFEILNQTLNYESFLRQLPDVLQNNLQNSGYDLVYLDYDDGGTYIQRNAYLLQALIKKVNEEKKANGSTEPNVVMGISMGGLVSRYALADMERLGENHDTRLFISFDSPHQGANVPLGFQYAAYHLPQVRFGGQTIQQHYEKNPLLSLLGVPSPDIGIQLAENPAARQMLIQQAVTPYNKHIVNNNPYHQEFMRDYEALDYPKKCRNVAIANGSQIAKGQGFDPGNLLFHFESGSWRTSVYGVEELWNVLGFNNIPSFLGGTAGVFTAAIVLPVVNILVGYKSNIQVRALENYSSDWQTVYRGHISGRILAIPVAFSTFEAHVKQLPPLDSAPGGRIDYADQVDISDPFDLYTAQGSFCFIPTVSALDIRDAVPDELNLNVQNANILTNARTAFEDYDAPDAGFALILPDGSTKTINNEFHTSFSSFNARLLHQYLIGADMPGTFLSRSSYNFGAGSTLSTTHRMSDMSVYSGGQLLVNANIPIGPGQDAGENPPPLPNTTFEVFVSPYANCDFTDGEVNIWSGGELVLGEANPNNKGVMRFQQGSTLILRKGSRLLIHKNSQLIIECGATLVFEEGAVIETEGDDNRLTIDGQLQLKEGTDFPYAYTTGNSSSPDVTDITIKGSDWVCATGTTFQLSSLPEGTEVCWSVEGTNMSIAGDACGNAAFVKTSAASGTGTIQASIRYVGACEDIPPSVVTRTVKLGTVSPSDITITGAGKNDTVCPGQTYTFTATPGNYQGYQWTVRGVGKIESGQGTSTIRVTTNSDNPAGSISVAVDNGCGYSHEANKTLMACNSISVQTYPVPTTDYLNLSISSFYEGEVQDAEEVTGTEAYEVKLYNDHSGLVRQIKSKRKQIKLDVSDLSAKVYLLQVTYKGMTASKKILIGKP